MRSYIDRIAKLETMVASRQTVRRVERHIIKAGTDIERAERIAAIASASQGDVLHICRVIVPGATTLESRRTAR